MVSVLGTKNEETRPPAPLYRGSGKLTDRVAPITGGDSGIGRAVAVLFAREGADVAIVYLNENADAEITMQKVEAESKKYLLIAGSAIVSLLDYSMTKGGIHAFTRSLATHLVPRGIGVNAVAPGPVWTPLNSSDKTPQDVSEFGSDTPMKGPAQPEEIAPAYVFLPSPQCSSYVTGKIVPTIGGYSGG